MLWCRTENRGVRLLQRRAHAWVFVCPCWCLCVLVASVLSWCVCVCVAVRSLGREGRRRAGLLATVVGSPKLKFLFLKIGSHLNCTRTKTNKNIDWICYKRLLGKEDLLFYVGT